MTDWATLAEVQDITKDDGVTAQDVAVAQEVIVSFTGRTPDDNLRLRDLYWLKRAVAWQASWQKDQPGYNERSMAKEVTQDATKVVYAGTNEALNPALQMLAPLAFRSLKNCSWMKSRSARWQPARPPRPNLGWPMSPFPFDYKSNDDHPWERL